MVWKEIAKIPSGQTRTYKELAENIGRPKSSRAVANACGKNPIPPTIPCHRVVMSNGKVGGYAYGEHIKTKMLNDEGIKIENGKILDWEKTVYRF